MTRPLKGLSILAITMAFALVGCTKPAEKTENTAEAKPKTRRTVLKRCGACGNAITAKVGIEGAHT